MDVGASRSSERLERFLPHADVRERHEIVVRAPADRVFDLAKRLDLRSVGPVRAIFRLRELLLGARRVERPPRGLVEETLALGWGVLAEDPGRFFAAGAVCQPWLADVTFQAVEPEGFASYAVPGRVKIAWTLEARPLSPGLTRFVTETRAAGTDADARDRFRRYWRLVGRGVVLIRLLHLRALRREAERRFRTGPGGRSSRLIRLHHTGGLPPGSEFPAWDPQEKEKEKCPNC